MRESGVNVYFNGSNIVLNDKRLITCAACVRACYFQSHLELLGFCFFPQNKTFDLFYKNAFMFKKP